MGGPEGEVLAILPVHAVTELGDPELGHHHHHHQPGYSYAGQLTISLSRVRYVYYVCALVYMYGKGLA